MAMTDRRPHATARRPRGVLSLLVVTALLLSLFTSALAPAPAAAQAGPCAAPANAIVAENCLTGNPSSEWSLGGADTSAIEGFATDISVDQGQTVQFKVKTAATAYHIDVYRLGYYAGLGARKIATIPNTATVKQAQPACQTDATVALIDCGNWAVSASWTVPSTAVSGLYIAKMVREDGTPGANHMYFVVRDDDGNSELLFQTSDTTWQAYNSYGGASLYVNTAFSNGVNRAYKVSYNRPFITGTVEEKNFLFNAEQPMIRFLERNGYDVSYAAGVDSDRRGPAPLQAHKVFLSVGHDEYWSGAQRANVEAAREAGVHLAFFSGNEVYWKTRYENNYRTLVTYKETFANARIDPMDLSSGVWTGTWRDPRFSPPADGGRPENRLSGTIFTVQGTNGGITVPAEAGKNRFWRNTAVASLAPGTSATVGTETLGFEWDEDLDNGARPPGAVTLATGTRSVNERLTDFGSNVAPGTATHAMNLYRHPTRNGAPSTSGALVFGAGTVQYSWGLDAVHARGTNPAADPSLQQATVNLLADMGVQPATLMGGLVAAAASADAAAPTSAITSPAAGATVTGSVTVSGTASDSGGGRVGAVEVSTDSGQTWHPATGTTNWSYAWFPQTTGPTTIKSRAADDSGNIETPSAGVTVTADRACPCTIWNAGVTPATADAGDTNQIEVGVKFRSSADGFVTGIRFYKGAGNTGTHVGNLWSRTGARLATATFANETATGWQQVLFASPVAVTANTTYVASYYAPNGHYAFNSAYFGADVVTPPLRALANGADGGNGVYVYAAQSSFPVNSGNGSNYWVDVVFGGGASGTTDPLAITNVQANAVGTTSATVTWTTNRAADSQVEYNGTATPINTTLVTDHSVQLTGLSPSTTYTYRVMSKDANGETAVSSAFTFTTAAPGNCPCSIWNGGPVSGGQFGPGSSIELGVKFRSNTAGYITGVRFYKATNDTGTHVGSLWDNATGQLLASAEFVAETAAGWQEVAFPTAVPISANKTYVASYHTPLGRYVGTSGGLAAGVQSDVLRALKDGEEGGNGVFRDGSGFPTGSFGATNYWVDAVFTLTPPPPDTTAPVISDAQAVAVTSTSATITWTTDDASDTEVLYGPAVDNYPGDVRSPTLVRAHSLRITGLTPNATYHVRVKSTNSAGLSSTSADFFFSTLPQQPCTACSLWNNDTAPAVPYLTSPQPAAIPIEVGVKFRSSVAGKVLGVRFYKGALNTGTHVGHLWTAGGQLLASATFINETATGWQQVLFSHYVDIQPDTVYVASYTSPARAYAYTQNFFDTNFRNGPLEALSSLESPNGVYGDAAAGFPTQDGNRTNYWVDVLFSDQNVAPQGDGVPPRLIGRSPAPDATDAGLTRVTATFSEPVSAPTIRFELRDASGAVVPGSLSYDESLQTVAFTPNTPLLPGARYTAKVLAADDLESPPLSFEPLDPGNEAWSFTTGTCPCSFFNSQTPNPVTLLGPGSGVELGLKFRSDVAGYVKSVRFYQGSDNAGPHTGHIWEALSATTGTLVATSSDSINAPGLPGWKTLVFNPPVAIQGGKVYVASYSAPTGGYAFTRASFPFALRRGPIEALANGGTYGGNGVFGGLGLFPYQSSEATNYWVDAEFDFTAAPPPTPPSNLTLTRSVTALNEGDSLTLGGSFADPNAGDTHTVTVDWGDGTSTTLNLAAGVLTFSTSHPYADDNPSGTSSDTLALSVTVTDPSGGSATAASSITVNNVAPTATIGGTDSSPEGAVVNLGATVSDPGAADVLAYTWSVTKNGVAFGATGSGSVFSFTPDDNGSYVATLTVSDDDGGSTTVTKSITVTNVAPAGTITGAPTGSVGEGTTIALGSTATDASSVDAASLTRSWTVTRNGAAFATGSGASFGFTPNDNGSYIATLTVADKDGGQATDSKTIDVTNVAPTAAIAGAPGVGVEGTAIPLTGSATDPGTADTFTYAWSVTKNGAAFASGSGSGFSFTPDDNGSYAVSLIATDKDGGASQPASVTIPIINVVPTAQITGWPAAGSTFEVGETITVGSSVTDPSAPDTAAGFTRNWSVTKDGQPFGSPTTGPTFSLKPTAAGVYAVSLTATDKDGGVSGADTETVTFTNPVPKVTINGAPTASSPEGTAISLGSTVTNFLPGASLTYSWSVTKDGVAFGSGASGVDLNTFAFTPTDNGSYVVTLAVTAAGRTGSDSKTITVANVAPTVQITGAPATGAVGSAIALGSNVSDPSTADTAAGFTRNWSVTKDGQPFGSPATGATFSFTPSAAGTYVVSLTATDKDGGVSASDSVTISVANPLSVAITGAPSGASPEGTAITLGSTVTGAATGATITYSWSVKKNGAAYGTTGTGSGYSFTPNDDGSYVVTLNVSSGGNSASTGKTITVSNAAPSGLTITPSWTSFDEGDTITLSGAFADPGTADSHTVVISWGDGSANTTLNLAAGVLTYSTTHKYLDDNPTNSSSDLNVISVTVTDKDAGAATGSTNVSVYNRPPVLSAITVASSAPVRINGSVSLSATFTDLGVVDTHTARITWGDNTSSSGSVTEANGAGTVNATHTYTAAGTYTVKMTLTDDDTGSATSTYKYVVIYDPDGGWVAGAGSIDSPKGAYVPSPTATGKAYFGFVSKYPTSGSSVPVGVTLFQLGLKTANIEFFSSKYDWLVVSGAKATYQGSGTINGAGDYGFILSAIDGHQPGGDGKDRFRLKIWNKANGQVVYDNQDANPTLAGHQLGAPDDADPTMVISSGLIQIFDH